MILHFKTFLASTEPHSRIVLRALLVCYIFDDHYRRGGFWGPLFFSGMYCFAFRLYQLPRNSISSFPNSPSVSGWKGGYLSNIYMFDVVRHSVFQFRMHDVTYRTGPDSVDPELRKVSGLSKTLFTFPRGMMRCLMDADAITFDHCYNHTLLEDLELGRDAKNGSRHWNFVTHVRGVNCFMSCGLFTVSLNRNSNAASRLDVCFYIKVIPKNCRNPRVD